MRPRRRTGRQRGSAAAHRRRAGVRGASAVGLWAGAGGGAHSPARALATPSRRADSCARQGGSSRLTAGVAPVARRRRCAPLPRRVLRSSAPGEALAAATPVGAPAAVAETTNERGGGTGKSAPVRPMDEAGV